MWLQVTALLLANAAYQLLTYVPSPGIPTRDRQGFPVGLRGIVIAVVVIILGVPTEVCFY